VNTIREIAKFELLVVGSYLHADFVMTTIQVITQWIEKQHWK
jgi:hypothetical protein